MNHKLGNQPSSQVFDPRVQVIVVNWNGVNIIEDFIGSINSSTYQNKEVLIVDNASSDRSCEIIERYPAISLLHLNENRGWGYAINAGLVDRKAANADYFLFMNNDVFLEPDALNALVIQGENFPEFGILSPILYDNEGKLTYSGGFFTSLGWWKKELIPKSFKNSEPEELDIVIGAAMFVKAGVVDTIGGFDPEFFLYWEDIDYCTRAARAGFKIGVVPSSVATHVEGATTRKSQETARFDVKGIYDLSFAKYVFKHLRYPDLLKWLFTRRGLRSWGLIVNNFQTLIEIRRMSGDMITREE